MSKVIAITGAGQGLGRALARRFARDGHRLILLGRTQATLDAVASELGTAGQVVICDVASPASVRHAFATIAERHAQLDVLINNAAVYQAFLVKDASDEQIDAAVATNFAGPIHTVRAALPLMGKGSHIINISSETVTLPHAMFSLYQSSKAGLERFTRALHAELEPQGIRVTMARAGQMMDADSRPPVDPALAQQFAEENLKRGLDFRSRPISRFDSVADTLAGLVALPDDVNIPEMTLEARHR